MFAQTVRNTYKEFDQFKMLVIALLSTFIPFSPAAVDFNVFATILRTSTT